LQDGKGSPNSAQLLKHWQELAQLWQVSVNDSDTPLNETLRQKWNEQIESVRSQTLAQSVETDLSWRLQLEVFYNHLHPIEISTALYIVAFVLLLIGLGFQQKKISIASFFIFIAGIVVHTLGIGSRMVILERPPVSTLYESIIFVSWIAGLVAWWIENKLKNTVGIFIGSLTCAFLGALSFTFSQGEDTFSMLSAVLNTQFWLATHVLTITLGYGWCLVAAIMAHVVLFLVAFGRKAEAELSSLTEILHTVSLIALLFTTIGTILGGIWADQSWGRFWGWDPKENGALLIVLWLVWLQHGKLSHHIEGLWLWAGYAFLTVIVAVAWIGVNLLGVGLHSYGFIEGLYWGLAGFTLFEILVISGLILKAKRLKK
jgi:ABC-type transport system involved in cytochrome c biogenesis permease subunit